MPSFIADTDVQATYLRIAGLAIGMYDWLFTLPAEYRFYTSQRGWRRISYRCILFVLVRYISMTVISVSSAGFLLVNWSPEECHRMYLIAPALKVIQNALSQVVLAHRTYSISRQTRWVGWLLVVSFVISLALQFFSAFYKRIPVQSPTVHNCISGNPPDVLVAWIHYAVAIVFDLLTITISTGYLWTYTTGHTKFPHFLRSLLYEGLGYFALLSAVNVLNLCLFRNPHPLVQSAGVSLGYVITWIMTQRILINQRESSYGRTNPEPATTYTIAFTRSLESSSDIQNALRTQFESRKSKSMPRYATHTDSGSSRHQKEQGQIPRSTGSFTERHVTSPSLPHIQSSHGEGSQPRQNAPQQNYRSSHVSRYLSSEGSSAALQGPADDMDGEKFDVEVRIEQNVKIQYGAAVPFRERRACTRGAQNLRRDTDMCSSTVSI